MSFLRLKCVTFYRKVLYRQVTILIPLNTTKCKFTSTVILEIISVLSVEITTYSSMTYSSRNSTVLRRSRCHGNNTSRISYGIYYCTTIKYNTPQKDRSLTYYNNQLKYFVQFLMYQYLSLTKQDRMDFLYKQYHLLQVHLHRLLQN